MHDPVRRAEPRLDHRRRPPGPRRRARSTGHADLDHLAKLLVDVDAARPRPALVVTDTVFSMDGDVADVDALVDVCAGHDALARARRGPRRARAPGRRRGAADRGVTVLRIGTLSKTLGSLGGFVAGPRRVRRPAAQPGPPVHLHHRPHPGRRRPPPWPRCGSCARREGDALVARLRSHVDRLRPGHPSPIVPVVLGDEARGAGRGRRPAGRRACWCPPSARRRCRPGRPACGSRCRPPTPTSRSTGWSRSSPGDARGGTVRPPA